MAVNAVGAADAVEDGLRALRAGGVFCLFSGLPEAAAIPTKLVNEIHYRQLAVVGAYGCRKRDMESSLPILAAHAAAVEKLIEDEISLEQVEAKMPEILAGESFRFVVAVRRVADEDNG